MVNKYKKTIILLALILVGLTLTAVLYFTKNKRTGIILPNFSGTTKTVRLKPKKVDPNQELLNQLEKRIRLPKGNATIFTIANLGEFTNQPFFKDAKPDHKLIVFDQEKTAVLYDPVAQQIINIGPLVIITPTQTQKSPLIISPTKFRPNL